MTKKIKWTKELIHQEALKYNILKDFRINCRKAYNHALTLGIVDEVCSHMVRGKLIITDDDIAQEALKYNHRIDFRKNSQSFYYAAINRGLLDKVCSHMVPKRKPLLYSDKQIKEAVAKYDTYVEFYKNEKNIYSFLQWHNKIDQYLLPLIETKRKSPYTKEQILDIAATYDTVTDLRKYEGGLVRAAMELGIYDEVKNCMKTYKKMNFYTNDELKEEALKYNHRVDFDRNSPNKYRVACRRKILDDICSHMIPKASWGSDYRNVLYIWKVIDDDVNHLGMPLYKIGITSEKLQHRRIKDVASIAKFKYKIIYYKKREDCLMLEKQLLSIGTNPELVGFDGSCEFRAWDDQDLKSALSFLS